MFAMYTLHRCHHRLRPLMNAWPRDKALVITQKILLDAENHLPADLADASDFV